MGCIGVGDVCITHLLQKEESQSQSEKKMHSVNERLKYRIDDDANAERGCLSILCICICVSIDSCVRRKKHQIILENSKFWES